ncbi:MAG TPA: flagellar basal body L-ring protein FlgH [bacterium]|nr:flagellar basal body L-ring protein FlgH [bacterium]
MKAHAIIVTGALALAVLLGPCPGRAYESLYSDVKAAKVGDVVTVVIVENTQASNSSKISTDKATTFATKADPGTGALDFITGLSANADISRAHAGNGSTERQGSIVSKMAAVVTEVSANGCLVIKGQREIVINDEKETLVLTGMIRPRDISTGNVVYSTDIANAQITYKGKGMVTSGSKPSILARMLSLLF